MFGNGCSSNVNDLFAVTNPCHSVYRVLWKYWTLSDNLQTRFRWISPKKAEGCVSENMMYNLSCTKENESQIKSIKKWPRMSLFIFIFGELESMASVSVYAFGRVSIAQRWSQYTEFVHWENTQKNSRWIHSLGSTWHTRWIWTTTNPSNTLWFIMKINNEFDYRFITSASCMQKYLCHDNSRSDLHGNVHDNVNVFGLGRNRSAAAATAEQVPRLATANTSTTCCCEHVRNTAAAHITYIK